MKYFILESFPPRPCSTACRCCSGSPVRCTFAGLAEATAGLAYEPIMVVALFRLIVSFGFKIAAVPFHFWAPDTYERRADACHRLPVGQFEGSHFVAFSPGHVPGTARHLRGLGPGAMDPGRAVDDGGQPRRVRQTNIVRASRLLLDRPGGVHARALRSAAKAGADLAEAFSATLVYLVIYADEPGASAVVMRERKTRSGEIQPGRVFLSRHPGWRCWWRSSSSVSPAFRPWPGGSAKFAMFRSVIIAGGTATVVLAAIAAVTGDRPLLLRQGRNPSGSTIRLVISLPMSRRHPPGSLRLALLVSLVITVVVDSSRLSLPSSARPAGS